MFNAKKYLNDQQYIYFIYSIFVIIFTIWFYFTIWPIINLTEFLKLDMNYDNKNSIGDVFILLREIYFEPGSKFIQKFTDTKIFQLFELDQINKISFLTGFVSFIFFSPIFVLSFLQWSYGTNQSDFQFVRTLFSNLFGLSFLVFFISFLMGKI